MAWFKVDDRAHSHPKILAAGTAAFGLWARCGSYAADHSTDGVIPRAVARMYGSAAMARALVDAGLWHAAGHACDRCAQPPAGDYVIHDYLEYNPSKADVAAERAAARERMKRRRSRGVRPNTGGTGGEGSDGVPRPRPHPSRPGVPAEPPSARGSGGDRSAAPPPPEGGTLVDLVRGHTGADPDRAAAVLDHIRDRHRPRSLSAYVRTMAARGTLADVLDELTPASGRVRPHDEWMYRQ